MNRLALIVGFALGLAACSTTGAGAPSTSTTPTTVSIPTTTTLAATTTTAASRPTLSAIETTSTMGSTTSTAGTTSTTSTTTTSTSTTSTTTPTTTTTTQEEDDAILVADSRLGKILVDHRGRTLYIFEEDSGGESVCYQGCESTWPIVEAGLGAGKGVKAKLSSHKRADGKRQLVVNGRPVYRYAGDQSPGDVNGQGVGNVWFVLGPDGEPIKS